MQKTIYLKILALASGILILTLHFLHASDVSYSYFFWEALHFAGGIALGLLFFRKQDRLITTLLLVITIGFVWELYEYYIRNIPFWFLDTIIDFGLEIIGACLAVSLLRKLTPKTASPGSY